MNVKQKLGYMFIGCLFTIAGYILASLDGGATHAQQNEQVIDKIVCRELEVVNEEGKKIILIGTERGGGVVSVKNKEGKTIVDIKNRHYIGAKGGEVRLYNGGDGHSYVFMAATLEGGYVRIAQSRWEGEGSVSMSTLGEGGFVGITNENGKRVVSMFTDGDDGTGIVSVSDSNEKSVAEMSVDKIGNGRIQTRKGVWRIH